MTSLISDEDRPGPDRRGFLRAAGAFAATVLTPGVTLYAFGASGVSAGTPGAPASAAKRWGMLIDVSKCGDGCKACVTACKEENGWGDSGDPRTGAQWIRKVTISDPQAGWSAVLPVMCQHCADPPCAEVCPTGASFKRADGIVLVDKHICIGCRYCMMACPYKARSFVHEPIDDQKPNAPRGKGTVESCNLCVGRIDAGQKPACVDACSAKAGGAMMFGDLNDPGSDIAKAVKAKASKTIRADLGLDPGVRYQNL